MSKITKYPFSDLYKMTSGISSTKEQAAHGAPFVSFSVIFNNYFLPDQLTDKMDTSPKEQEKFSVKKGDILITRTSETYNELAMSSVALKDYPNATFSGFSKRLRPLTTGIVYDKYMAFYLRSKLFRKTVTNNASMTLRASFNEDIFSFLNLFLPDYNEQIKMGNLLYNMEMKIRTNNKINEILRQQVSLLYDYWFIQFDFSDENGKPYKSSGGKMELNNHLKRDIPAGWTAQSMTNNDLCEIIKPGVDKFETKNYLATGDVNGTNISIGNIVEFATRVGRANMQPKESTVWFAKMKNSIKHLFLNREMNQFIEKTVLSTGFCGLQCREQSFEYISGFIAHSYFEKIKDNMAHGATQEAINNEDLSNVYILIPDDKVLAIFHKIARPIYAQISENICENQELTVLREWLLPMLMNGQASMAAEE